MARKRRRSKMNAGELNLTAMIDVAFQLLSFFIITVKPVDVYAHLNVFRPAPDAAPSSSRVQMIRITVFPDFYQVNEKPVGVKQLEALLKKLGDLDKNQTILIMCTNASTHERLVDLLDLCAKYKLVNLSVVSSGGY